MNPRSPILRWGALLAASFVITLTGRAAERPHILWLTSEDNNVKWIGCYGNPHASTPNIDQLATQGFRYTHCYANTPVCAPQRSTWITGVHSLSMGTHPMRSRYPIPHDRIPYYPDQLRAAGYFTSNHTKTDYNIGGRPDGQCWDSSEKFAWRKRAENQPFFCIVNFTESHESRAQGEVENTQHDPEYVSLRSYHPDVPDIRKNYAKYHDAVAHMDAGIGEALAELEKDGLAEDTIVIYNSDHGGVLPRSKRFLYQSGIHCPLIIRFPEKFRHLAPAGATQGATIDRLVAFIDMPKTWLSLAGAEIPDLMQGTVFLGEGTEPEQPFHFSYRGRMDERMDSVRAVRDKQFLYIRNYMPWAPAGQHLDYLWKMAATRAWEAEFDAGRTDQTAARFFLPKPEVEELYDTAADPDNVRNLAADPAHQEKLATMRAALRGWQLEIRDSGMLAESEVARRARSNDTTIFDLVRDPAAYDLPAYLDAADLALAKDSSNLDSLRGSASTAADPGVRYWATVGLFLLGSAASDAASELRDALADDSHEVRAMAAWSLSKLGDEAAARDTLRGLLQEKSYAGLTVLNIIDWMGGPDEGTLEVIRQLDSNEFPSDHADYVGRMREYFLEG
ncbi:sulfatase [soil metagenome]